MTDPQKSAVDEQKDAGYGAVEFDGVEYPILRKPNSLLLSELARTSSGDPEAMGVFAEFFEATLGDVTYRAFKKAAYRSGAEDEDLMAVLQTILEKTLGRPTE